MVMQKTELIKHPSKIVRYFIDGHLKGVTLYNMQKKCVLTTGFKSGLDYLSRFEIFSGNTVKETPLPDFFILTLLVFFKNELKVGHFTQNQ